MNKIAQKASLSDQIAAWLSSKGLDEQTMATAKQRIFKILSTPGLGTGITAFGLGMLPSKRKNKNGEEEDIPLYQRILRGLGYGALAGGSIYGLSKLLNSGIGPAYIGHHPRAKAKGTLAKKWEELKPKIKGFIESPSNGSNPSSTTGVPSSSALPAEAQPSAPTTTIGHHPRAKAKGYWRKIYDEAKTRFNEREARRAEAAKGPFSYGEDVQGKVNNDDFVFYPAFGGFSQILKDPDKRLPTTIGTHPRAKAKGAIMRWLTTPPARDPVPALSASMPSPTPFQTSGGSPEAQGIWERILKAFQKDPPAPEKPFVPAFDLK